MKPFKRQVSSILRRKLYIAPSDEFLEEEIFHNWCDLHIPRKERAEISLEEVVDALETIKSERARQLNKSSLQVDFIYYSWVDAQAEQLRFNFISSRHAQLPFGCRTVLASDEREIVEDYFSSLGEDLLNVSLWEETEADGREADDDDFILKVYTETIRHKP